MISANDHQPGQSWPLTNALISARRGRSNKWPVPGSAASLLRRDPLALVPGRTELPWAGPVECHSVSERLWTWVVKYSRKYRNRPGPTWNAGDTYRRGPAGEHSGGRVACCLQAGVRGSSPLSCTGQRHNSTSWADSTAAKCSNRDRVRCRTRVRVGLVPRAAAACGARISGSWAGIRAAEQNAIGRIWT